jgi:hypothetical protein
MITSIDDDYQIGRLNGGNGIAKKWGLGENCPQYLEFTAMARTVGVAR